MDVFGERNAGTRRWFFAGLLLAGLLMSIVHTSTSAESQEDSDLVFDILESKNYESLRRIARESSDLSNSSPPVEDQHWLSSTVDRLKRSIGGLFINSEGNGENERVQKSTHDKNHSANHLKRKSSAKNRQKSDHLRTHRQASYQDRDEYEYDGEAEGEESFPPIASDDEDIAAGFASGDLGSGEVETAEPPTTTTTRASPSHPRYYRSTFTALEPYVAGFNDRNSYEFVDLATNVEDALKGLFADQVGIYSFTVISIEKDEEDVLKIRITVDIESQGPDSSLLIENLLLQHISSQHRIGSLTVSPEDFRFRAFEDNRPTCQSDELQCRNLQCVPHSSRCDGKRDCSDNSDEDGCPTSPIIEEETTTSTTTTTTAAYDPSITAIPTNWPTSDADTTTSTTTTTTEFPDFGSGDGDGRADDILQCADGSKFYYGDQKCDGIQDCEDGSDEIDCLGAQDDCAQGEFSCDFSRCIPVQKRCDGVPDCSDSTDEQECSRCENGALFCDGKLGYNCIPVDRICDKNQDCRDGADERDCEASRCSESEFDCGDGECIPSYLRCSGEPECRNQHDEYGCQTSQTLGTCRPDQFRCHDGECIPLEWQCNRQYECLDQSDEKNCPCRDTDFHCLNGFCIPYAQRCDGTRHCQDQSDEIGCENITRCEHYQWRCSNGDCIDQIYRCNHNIDCGDGSDEKNCSYCTRDHYRCGDGSCIDVTKRCNGVGDCPNSEDEEQCEYCGQNQYKCHNGQCIPEVLRCDGNYDCLDSTDEIDCLTEECGADQLRCRDGTCVTGVQCDRVYDCLDGTDEQNCEYCSIEEFKCRDGQCIHESLKCNGVPECRDGSDEEECEGCLNDEFDCEDGTCLEIERKCDGYRDCSNGRDEDGCPEVQSRNESNQATTCRADQFDCGQGECIDLTFRCDNYRDCMNGTDEIGCDCRVDEFRCNNGVCIPSDRVCDRNPDCEDASDEANCRRACQGNEFRCHNNDCVPNHLRCDGRRDCSDGSDELECACPSDKFQCTNGQCVEGYLRCDRTPDCSDGSDEYNCPYVTPETTTRPYLPPGPTGRPDAISCPDGYVHCLSGNQCVERNRLCDGRVDCNDMSDESSCIGTSDGLLLKTYPSQQEIKENIYKLDREVVFQCRDEGPLRARVQWTRANGQPLPPGSRDINGRLEMPNIRLEHGGTYVCSAVGYPPRTPGAQVAVQLHVEKGKKTQSSILKYGNLAPLDTEYHGTACGLNQSTCSNGDCISKNQVCDGRYDCTDGSDESRCSLQCEPNEFKCDNKKCVIKTWVCDAQDDCGDGSDEAGCARTIPGSDCGAHQFRCHRDGLCIPKAFHCDEEPDCGDRSDEIGCAKPVVSRPPPQMVKLQTGQTFEISCRAVGVPTPQIVWRLNWGHIPPKCKTRSNDGEGVLVCEDIQVEDQGAYSCEAINTRGTTFAVPDTILIVNQESVCRSGYFNVDARLESECIKCFCFGHTTSCRSADLFVFQFQPPFDVLKLLGARVDPYTGVVDIRDEPIYKGAQPHLQPVGANGVYSSLQRYGELIQPDVVPYFALPENYHGNQLKSYGGYLRYSVAHGNRGRPLPGPDVIFTGNNYVLLHESRQSPQPYGTTTMQVRFFDGDWIIKSDRAPQHPATREEIMMALENVTNILIKLEYNEGILNTTLSNIEMDSAAKPDSGLGTANYVEECSCPVGYTGFSCESCASGYVRHESGPWLGQCYREPPVCPQGSYYDGTDCQICPCPHTNPSNQFARTCHLGSDGNVVCDCQAGYVGLRCEQCDRGYSGNPLVTGDFCRPESHCSIEGSTGTDVDGRCVCKEFTHGPSCNQCKPNTFYLSTRNQFGCISCFCMGVTQQCSSSNWYRDTLSSYFTTSTLEFKLVEDIDKEAPISLGIRLDKDSREIAYSSFSRPNVYYWSLPRKYLGDKVTSYGGYLRYTIRNTPVPGGASSRNNAPDVELVSANNINLLHFSSNASSSSNSQTFVVPLLEQYWQRNDGLRTDREHLLMALADVSAIYIKATYFTNTQEAALMNVSLDIASERNTGSFERALEVEQCYCPTGYAGLSCEDCAYGYTRSGDGIYLELCVPCECNGYSNDCDPEIGVCRNCRDNTYGEHCDLCRPGYVGDPARGQPCIPRSDEPAPCSCDERGAAYSECRNGICQCKPNVEGPSCDRCRNGTFGLDAVSIDGCEFCFCSGVSSECSESNFYVEQIPVTILEDHGFTLTDQYYRQRIASGFNLNPSLNEIGFNFAPSQRERMYWSLPSIFTGNKLKSYGGKLEFMQRYLDFPHATYVPDKDVIITGNSVVVYWTNPQDLRPEIVNSVSIRLHPSAGWYRLDQNRAPRPASREDLLIVLANIETILVRATLSTDTSSTYLSDITLDTAVDINTGKPRASTIEVCRCPQGYRGTSCESCASGYYKDLSFSDTSPLGSCRRCPCSNHEESCQLDNSQRVICNCLPGYSGRNCELETPVIVTVPPRPNMTITPPTPPSIEVVITGHTLQIYEVGSTVRLNCSATSRLAPRTVRVHWSKDYRDLPYTAIDDGRGLLVITNLQVPDSGRYICEADDGYSIVTQSVNIVVGVKVTRNISSSGKQQNDVPPAIVVSPPVIDVSEGGLIEVRCLASGNPIPELLLSRADHNVLNPSHTFANGVFRITQARSSDQGFYQCVATNRAGTDSRSFEVRVSASSVLRVRIDPAQYTGRVGEDVVLRCMADRAQIVRWSKQNGNLPYRSRDENGLLYIPSAQADDAGVYICTATSYDGTRGVQTVTVSLTGDSGVYPSARVSQDRITLRQGDSVEIKCDASGSPPPTVKWTKVQGDFGANLEQIGSTLHIRNAKIEDRGVYICVVTNSLGIEQAVSTVEVTRFEAPLLQIYPESTLTIVAGNSAHLQCRTIQGYPSPTITWSRENGRPLGTNVEIMSGGTLRLTRITQNEEGAYVCTASNDAGTATAVATVVVHTLPELQVTPNEDMITRYVDEHLRLECRGTGIPEPNVRWQKEGLVPSVRGSSNLDESQVSRSYAVQEFTRLTTQDAGVYVCVGESGAGINEKRVLVDIYPERGDNPDQHPGGGDVGPRLDEPFEEFNAIAGGRAEIRCRITSSSDVETYTDWIRANNATLPPGAYIREGVLYIDNVQPSAAGDYECVSYSTRDRQVVFRVRSRLRVLSPPRIMLNPSRQVVEPGQDAYIDCSATGDQPIQIEWNAVNRTIPASVYRHDGYIRFNNIDMSDAGMYRCTARNSAGEADSVAEVIVAHQRPTIQAENRFASAAPGSTVSMRCRAGKPEQQNNIEWIRENNELPRGSRISGGNLTIYNIKKEDEGRYHCEIRTPDGTVSDYFDLQVQVQQPGCRSGWWRCGNGKCISPGLVCDGSNDCEDNSDEISGCADWTRRGPSVKSLPSPNPALHISPAEREYSAGENVDLYCQSNEPGVIPTWSKLGGWLADNVRNNAGRLMIYNARVDNAGVYRCEATGRQGIYHKDYNLYVRDEEEVNDDAPVEVKRVKRQDTVVLDCNSDLEQPVTYLWSKQGGTLPSYVDERSKTIVLNSVGSIDAGTYVCSVTNDKRTLDVPIILIVTGIIPYFTQAPNSYISLPTLPDAYLHFSFEISFKPENDYGLILYNGNREREREADFISLALENGIPQFKFNLGHGTATTTIQADEPIVERDWHTVKVVRNKKRVIMFVDGKGPYIGEHEGKYFGLDLSEPLFLGGVPDYGNISPDVEIDRGLVGCVSRFKIGYAHQDILQEALNTTGITNCETCTENKCLNQGACQEALTTEGYTCVCPAGFSGPTCNKLKGEACSPYSCGVGRCQDTETGFQCQCPLGRAGLRCEKSITIFEPAFRNDAYLAYPPPRPLRRTRIEMKIKPRDVKDGLLLYAAETAEGHGDFISLAIRDRHVEFRFDNGNGASVIRSDEEIIPDQWSAILAVRSPAEGRVIINGHASAPTRLPGNHKTFTLLTPLYIGGYDKQTVTLNKGVQVRNGFNGCIIDLNVSGLTQDLRNTTDSSNVEECNADEDMDNNIFSPEYAHEHQYKPIVYDSKKNGCSDSPCKHGAECVPLSPLEYRCNCPNGFTGTNCETAMDPCRDKPCMHEGNCRPNVTTFTCDCPLGFAGPTCDQRYELRNDAHFNGDGYLEFSRSLLSHQNDDEAEIVALEFSTNKPDGLVFWHGQSPDQDGRGQDYIALAVSNGYLEFSYDLGMGPAIIRNTGVRVDDGERHSVILKREGRVGSIDVDHMYVEEGQSEGITTTMNCNGNIFLGGAPNVTRMSGGRFAKGFDGCIHGFELQQSKTMDLGVKAINGLNVKPCSSFNDMNNNIFNFDELVN
ncbi:basement membrane-specific heparan sulfate proteoglycan core protein isoform X3 [Cylas formicarius]|uniref:basement membrane-specific heparan sulfate proteoglycan core protein isoform X3 n=1 Tax=Cylas formicarius TaxID=197179 RepID=UPI0029587573|nr:basement membrane-specific heparan sulfate proteoglycan core protein isoform X3 [Cylas formicarius]